MSKSPTTEHLTRLDGTYRSSLSSVSPVDYKTDDATVEDRYYKGKRKPLSSERTRVRHPNLTRPKTGDGTPHLHLEFGPGYRRVPNQHFTRMNPVFPTLNPENDLERSSFLRRFVPFTPGLPHPPIHKQWTFLGLLFLRVGLGWYGFRYGRTGEPWTLLPRRRHGFRQSLRRSPILRRSTGRRVSFTRKVQKEGQKFR